MPAEKRIVDEQKIALGSGKVYCLDYAGSVPEDAAIETDDNILALIQGGASIEYTKEIYEAKDDLGLRSKMITTSEKALLKMGLCTFNADVLKKLVSTSTVSVDETKKRRTIKIGGIAKEDGKIYLLRFVNDDPVDGKTRITIAGKNQAGLTLSYTKDKETILNPEFKAQAIDNEGTLIIYDEEIISETTQPEALTYA